MRPSIKLKRGCSPESGDMESDEDQSPLIVEFLVETKKLLDDFLKYLEHMDSRIKKIETQILELASKQKETPISILSRFKNALSGARS